MSNLFVVLEQVLTRRPEGLYCPLGDFYVDPWAPVERAVITHGHSDHSRAGSRQYYCSIASVPILRHRLGRDINVSGKEYGEKFNLGKVEVSLFPAGHILGSAQVLIDSGQHRLVVSGDYKRGADPSCAEFQVVKCDTFITEATFCVANIQMGARRSSGPRYLSMVDAQ